MEGIDLLLRARGISIYRLGDNYFAWGEIDILQFVWGGWRIFLVEIMSYVDMGKKRVCMKMALYISSILRASMS